MNSLVYTDFFVQPSTVHCLFCIYLEGVMGALINVSSWADPISVTSGLKTSGSAYTELSYTHRALNSLTDDFISAFDTNRIDRITSSLEHFRILGLWRYYGLQRLEFVGSGISSSVFLSWVERVSLCFHCLEFSAHQSFVFEFVRRLRSTLYYWILLENLYERGSFYTWETFEKKENDFPEKYSQSWVEQLIYWLKIITSANTSLSILTNPWETIKSGL